MTRLKDKVAVITGAGSGMGKSTAILFAKEGAKIIVSDINESTAQTVVDEIVKEGGEAVAVAADVSKEADVQNMIDTAVEKFGTLDMLVNNAGILDNFISAGEVTDELWDKVIAVNTTGVMRAVRKALSIFIEKESGNIINIASLGGLMGCRAGVSYTASKHAVIGMTKNIGYTYATKGIRCNAIAPGGVKTNIAAGLTAPDKLGCERVQTGMCINPRIGEPEEIATIALFLASDDASFVTGTVITADAGWTAY